MWNCQTKWCQALRGLMMCLVTTCGVSTLTLAQEPGKHGLDYTYAEGSPQYWRGMHSSRPGNFVFRKDPHIWVVSPEMAKKAGLPLEWASEELQGVSAAAWRMQPVTSSVAGAATQMPANATWSARWTCTLIARPRPCHGHRTGWWQIFTGKTCPVPGICCLRWDGRKRPMGM
jgi:hypothetical protein